MFMRTDELSDTDKAEIWTVAALDYMAQWGMVTPPPMPIGNYFRHTRDFLLATGYSPNDQQIWDAIRRLTWLIGNQQGSFRLLRGYREDRDGMELFALKERTKGESDDN